MLFCQANCFNFSLVKTVFLSSILNCEKRKTLKNELNVELMLVVYKLEGAFYHILARSIETF